MCKLLGKYIDSEEYVGYKVATECDGRYFSPATGVEYKVGPVPKLTNETERNTEAIYGFNPSFKDFMTLHSRRFFSSIFNGKTAVIKKESDAKKLFADVKLGLEPHSAVKLYLESHSPYNIVLLKMKISGDLYEGETSLSCDDAEVIAGNTIVSFEKVAL